MIASPTSTLAMLATLALAIGANTAVYSVVKAVLLNPLPYPAPERMVAIMERNLSADAEPGTGNLPAGLGPMSAPNFYDYAGQNRVFEAFSGFSTGDAAILVNGHDADKVWSAGVLDHFFEVVRIQPLLGRTFLPEEEQKGRNKVVILSYAVWQRWYGGSPDVLGKTLRFEGEPHVIVGVMPPGFQFPEDALIWHPAAFPPDIAPRNMSFIHVLGRLAPGISLEAAQSHMDGLAAHLATQYPTTNKEMGIFLIRMQDYVTGEVRRPLLVLWSAVSLLLLLACSNVAGLLLARATARGREMAIRTAVGASRPRLVRQVLVESLLLSLTGGALGLLLAALGIRALKLIVGDAVPRLSEAALDPGVLGFALAVSLASGLVFGLVPALRSSKSDIGQAFKNDVDRAVTGLSDRGLRRALIIVQIAIAMTLVVGAGLLLRSFTRLLSVDPGFRSENVLTGEIKLAPSQYPDRPTAVNFYKELIARVSALPGVKSAGTTFFLPMSGQSATVVFKIDDRPDDQAGKRNVAVVQSVTPAYLKTIGVPLLRGREFTDHDDFSTQPIALVDEEAARQFWPNENPIGKRITFNSTFATSEMEKVSHEIVGVVGRIRADGLDKPYSPHIYFPNYQSTWRWSALAIRTDRNPEQISVAVQREATRIDPTIAIGKLESFDRFLRDSTAKLRMSTWLMGVLAGLALLLAAVGVFGLVGYSIERRTRELAIRMAVGAPHGQVVWLVMAEGVVLGLSGIFLGLCGALAVTRVLVSLLYEVSPLDVPTFSFVACGLTAVVLLASYVPARRILRLVPSKVLRVE